MKKIFIIAILCSVVIVSFSQHKISVIVTDSSGQEKLQGVSVVIDKTKKKQ